MAAKILEYGANRPLSISLPDKYWDILFLCNGAQLEGVEDVNSYVAEIIKHGIVADMVDDQGYFGELLCKGWKETLKDDTPLLQRDCRQ